MNFDLKYLSTTCKYSNTDFLILINVYDSFTMKYRFDNEKCIKQFKRTILQISQFGNFHLQIVVYVEITISVLKKTNINHLISSSCVSDINLCYQNLHLLP